MSLQKNYLQIIKYTLDYSDNSKSPTNLLKIKEEKDIYISSIRINLFENFITNKQSFLILRKELTAKQKIRCKQFTTYSIISTIQTKVITIFF